MKFLSALLFCLALLAAHSFTGCASKPPPPTEAEVVEAQMDEQTAALEEVLSDATVERVPQGIKVTFHTVVLFDFDSADLKDAAIEALDLFSESLNRYDNTNVIVIGHTDSVGRDEYNQQLSLERAESVAEVFRNQNVRENRLDVEGKGEDEPIGDNETPEGRDKNRRVEVIITSPVLAGQP